MILIRTTTRLGKYKRGKNQPISIQFEKKSHANILYSSKSWLPKGVYVDGEYTLEKEHQRKLLHPILRLAHTIEKYQGKCKLEENQLVILGIKYGINDIHKLPDDLSGFHTASKTTNKVHAFFGELSPFSNFHHSKFELNGVTYFCSEHIIQAQRTHYCLMTPIQQRR